MQEYRSALDTLGRTPYLGAGLTHLDERAFRSTNELLKLFCHGSSDGRLDSDEQVLLAPAVLQDDSKGVLNFALDVTLCTEESSHGLRPSEESEGLVDAVGPCLMVSTRSEPTAGSKLTKTEGHA